MPEFKPNHFVDGPYIELNGISQPVRDYVGVYADDDENLAPIRKRDTYCKNTRIRAVGRGNYGGNNYQMVIEAVEIIVALTSLDINTKEKKRRETVISSYVPTGKRNMTYEQCAEEIDGMRSLFKDPKSIEPLVKHLNLPYEIKERYLEKINPFRRVATAMVMYGSSVVLVKERDEDGQEKLTLPLARVGGAVSIESKLITAFFRAGRVGIERVSMLPPKTDMRLRIEFQGATAYLDANFGAYAHKDGSSVTLVEKGDVLSDRRIDPESRMFLSWIMQKEKTPRDVAVHP